MRIRGHPPCWWNRSSRFSDHSSSELNSGIEKLWHEDRVQTKAPYAWQILQLAEEDSFHSQNQGNKDRFGSAVIEHPVPVMAVKVPKQSVCNKNIPEMIPQDRRVNVPLLICGVQDIWKLCTRSIAVRIENNVLDGAEVKKTHDSGCEVPAGANKLHLVTDGVGPEYCLLSRNTNQVEDAAGKMLADTAVCVTYISHLNLDNFVLFIIRQF